MNRCPSQDWNDYYETQMCGIPENVIYRVIKEYDKLKKYRDIKLEDMDDEVYELVYEEVSTILADEYLAEKEREKEPDDSIDWETEEKLQKEFKGYEE